MRFSVRPKIGNRLGSKSTYTLREFCINLVGIYSLTDKEINEIISLQPGQVFQNEDLEITRLSR